MSGGESQDESLDRATAVIRSARAILIGAGAGMGVDSGLPDFRGDHGFWKAYPPYARLGLRFTELANPRWFQRDPEFAWGFYFYCIARLTDCNLFVHNRFRSSDPSPGRSPWSCDMKSGSRR